MTRRAASDSEAQQGSSVPAPSRSRTLGHSHGHDHGHMITATESLCHCHPIRVLWALPGPPRRRKRHPRSPAAAPPAVAHPSRPPGSPIRVAHPSHAELARRAWPRRPAAARQAPQLAVRCGRRAAPRGRLTSKGGQGRAGRADSENRLPNPPPAGPGRLVQAAGLLARGGTGVRTTA